MYTVIKCLSKHCQNGETKEEADESRGRKRPPRRCCVSAANAKVNADFLVNKRTSGAVHLSCTSPNYIPHREKERERERPCSSCSNFPPHKWTPWAVSLVFFKLLLVLPLLLGKITSTRSFKVTDWMTQRRMLEVGGVRCHTSHAIYTRHRKFRSKKKKKKEKKEDSF